MTKPLDKLIYDHKTRRQQKGMPDRWRLLEELDPCQFVILRSQDGNVKYSSAVFARRSEIKKLKEEYGENMEVLYLVYIITSGEYSGYSIRAVTLDKDKAKLLKKMYMAKGYEFVEIEEYQEDDTGDDFSSKEEMTEPVKYYHVRISKIDRQNNYVNIKYRFEHKPPHGEFGKRWDKHDRVDTDIYQVEVEAKDEEHAKKIAQDMYAQALAEYYDLT